MRCDERGLYVSVGKVSRKKHLPKQQTGIEILLVGNCGLEYTRRRDNGNASELMDWEVHSEAFNKTESKRFDSRLRVYRQRLSIPRRSRIMATITPINTPHTRIENTIIANMAEMGVYCYAVYSAIKMHLNQATGACFPSYATIARITGIHRSTVIECVKKLRVLKFISPLWRFKEDGSHTSNQYNFQSPGKAGASPMQGAEHEASSPKSEEVVKTVQGGRPERPPLVGEDDHPGRPE
jgi:hypothetical protein